jgi:hypothetical protein
VTNIKNSFLLDVISFSVCKRDPSSLHSSAVPHIVVKRPPSHCTRTQTTAALRSRQFHCHSLLLPPCTFTSFLNPVDAERMPSDIGLWAITSIKSIESITDISRLGWNSAPHSLGSCTFTINPRPKTTGLARRTLAPEPRKAISVYQSRTSIPWMARRCWSSRAWKHYSSHSISSMLQCCTPNGPKYEFCWWKWK